MWVCLHEYSIYVYLPAQISMQFEKLRLQLKWFLAAPPAVFPLKSKVLTAAAVDDEFFLTPDSHSCWLFWNMLLKFPFVSGWQLLSTSILVHWQPQIHWQTHKTQIHISSVEWGEERVNSGKLSLRQLAWTWGRRVKLQRCSLLFPPST